MASLRHRPDKGGRWYVYWREGGRGTKNNSRAFRTEAEALAFKTQVEGKRTATRQFGPDWGEPDYFERHPERDIFNVASLQPQEDSFVNYARQMIELQDIRPGTRALYLRVLRLHFEGTELGATPIRSVTPDVIQTWWRNLPDTEAKGVRRQAHQVLAKVLNRAVAVGDIDVSPLKRLPEITRPRTGRAEIEPLDVDEIEALAEAATGSQWDEYSGARNRLEILVMSYGGLRAGELGALRVSDVTRENGQCKVRVRQQVVRIRGGDARLADVKTAAARRTVYIPCSVADDIDAMVERFGPARDGRLFYGRKGAFRYAHLVNHSVASAGRKIGLDVNAHQLRHTAASLLRRSGADIRALQRFMGHSDIRVTVQTYSHLYGDELGDLAERMEALRKGHRHAE